MGGVGTTVSSAHLSDSRVFANDDQVMLSTPGLGRAAQLGTVCCLPRLVRRGDRVSLARYDVVVVGPGRPRAAASSGSRQRRASSGRGSARSTRTRCPGLSVPDSAAETSAAVQAMRDAFEHIDERAEGKVKIGELHPEALTIFDQPDFVSDSILRYRQHQLNFESQVIQALVDCRELIMDAIDARVAQRGEPTNLLRTGCRPSNAPTASHVSTRGDSSRLVATTN